MRSILLALATLTLVVIAVPARADEARRGLSADEVMKSFETGYQPAVRDCWVRHGAKLKGANGRFTIELVIAPEGKVTTVSVKAVGPKAGRLEECVRMAAKTWSFPERSAFTAVEIPVILVKTNAPGAGPSKK